MFKKLIKWFKREDEVDKQIAELEKSVERFEQSADRVLEIMSSKCDELDKQITEAVENPSTIKFELEDGSVCDCEIFSEDFDKCMGNRKARMIFK